MEHIIDRHFIFNPLYIILFAFEAKIHVPKGKINMIKVEPKNDMNCLNRRELSVNKS